MSASIPPRRLAGELPPLEAYDADVIILSRNRQAETLEAIASALAQRGGVFHVTVLDQGSPPEMHRALAAKFGKAKSFALYAVETNLGVAAGRNLATSLGHGQIIVAMDNDATFKDPWVVANALRRFAREPDLGALGFAILAADGEQPDLTSWGYPLPLLRRFHGAFDSTTFVGAGHAIRRTACDAAGGYDPAFFFTWEEYDFCLRAIARGWRIAYDGSLQVIHKVSAEERITWTDERMTYFVRNRLLIGRKWSAPWLVLAPRIFGYALKGYRNGCFAGVLAGIRAAWASTPLPRQRMASAMRDYIWVNETRHRGSWSARLRDELLHRIDT